MHKARKTTILRANNENFHDAGDGNSLICVKVIARMAEEKLPRLTEAHVRVLATEKSFERGQTYYRDGAVLEPVRQARDLRAQCEGSD